MSKNTVTYLEDMPDKVGIGHWRRFSYFFLLFYIYIFCFWLRVKEPGRLRRKGFVGLLYVELCLTCCELRHYVILGMTNGRNVRGT